MTSQSDRRTLSRELLRDVNERVASLASRDEEILSFLCECADDFCVDQVVLQLARYGEIRDSGGYVLAPGAPPPPDLRRVARRARDAGPPFENDDSARLTSSPLPESLREPSPRP